MIAILRLVLRFIPILRIFGLDLLFLAVLRLGIAVFHAATHRVSKQIDLNGEHLIARINAMGTLEARITGLFLAAFALSLLLFTFFYGPIAIERALVVLRQWAEFLIAP